MNVQKNGSALPPFIQSAFRWLEENALDHVGLFRKPGVKSRIQRLKQLAELDPDNLKFENHQAYDVADMVKQYFRELPEALLTNKLSESFIAIFQRKFYIVSSITWFCISFNTIILFIILYFFNLFNT